MNRKCFSIPSSYASFYIVTAFFAISFIFLFFTSFRDPNQYIDRFSPVRESNNEVVNNLSLIPSVDQQLSPPLLVSNPIVDQVSPPFVGNTPVNDGVGLSKPPSIKAKKYGQIRQPLTSVEEISEDYLAKLLSNKVSKRDPEPEPDPEPVDQLENIQIDDEDEEEDEAALTTYDHITYPPMNYTKEQRMKWFKQRVPESKIFESTPKTRKFDLKLKQFVRAKQCRVKIFLIWISSYSFFGPREIFSLESIVKEHPQGCVIIVSRIMTTKTGRKIIQPLLDRGHRILIIAPDFPLIFEGTPAQDWYERLTAGKQDPGGNAITQNLSNLLRLVLLYKYGGIYFDTDMIILKDVSKLRNSIGIQDVYPDKTNWSTVNNAVLIFDKKHPLLMRFMEEFNSNFNGSYWGYNGPDLATRVIKKVIPDSMYEFNIVSRMAFYPIGWLDIQSFFRYPYVNESSWNYEMFQKVSKDSYGVHLWNKASRNSRIEHGSIIGKLISTHCIICKDIYDS